MNGKRINLGNDWNNYLTSMINKNTKMNQDEERLVVRNQKLIEKMDTYKKIDDNGQVYYYFFPQELETIMYILLENGVFE